jgi:hypothetical protein
VSKTEYTVLGARQGAVLAAIKDRSLAPSFCYGANLRAFFVIIYGRTMPSCASAYLFLLILLILLI